MRRVLTGTLLSVALAGSLVGAAQAQGKQACSAGNCAEHGAGLIVGTAVGTFPAIFRSMKDNTVGFANDLCGKDASPGMKMAVQPLTFVPAVVNGLFEGPLHAMHNAWKYPAFTADSMSLGKEY